MVIDYESVDDKFTKRVCREDGYVFASMFAISMIF